MFVLCLFDLCCVHEFRDIPCAPCHNYSFESVLNVKVNNDTYVVVIMIVRNQENAFEQDLNIRRKSFLFADVSINRYNISRQNSAAKFNIARPGDATIGKQPNINEINKQRNEKTNTYL